MHRVSENPVTSSDVNPYEDPEAARTYDAENSARHDYDFYLDLARELACGRTDFSVLDIGAGTGALAVDLAAVGYRVTGIDPATAMLDVARHRPGGDRVTWIHGFADAAPEGTADLVVMTGHVAQYFVTDDSWAELLENAHRALRPGGHLAFESRNPGRRAWESWTPEHTRGTFAHPDGGEFTSWVELLEVTGDPGTGVVETHRGITEREGTRTVGTPETLVFRTLAQLEDSLVRGGFIVEQRFGDWSRGPVTADSVEHILISRRV